MNKQLLPQELIDDIRKISITAFHAWLVENGYTVSIRKNFFDNLEEALVGKSITIDIINKGLSELEENSDKKIHLYEAKNVASLITDKKRVLRHLREKYGMVPATKNWGRVKPKAKPTFTYLYWDDDVIKIKFSEQHFDVEFDPATETFAKSPRKVVILFIIDLHEGYSQLRFDRSGQQHTHKNDQGKITEGAFESFYKELLTRFFPDVQFVEMNLTGVANYISGKEKMKFRINKEVTTITGNGKQTFTSGSIKFDVRNLPEHSAASSTVESQTWLREDLSGYWLAEHSNGELKKDLFMRISRKVSEIRVQRGCLEKELNYGLQQVREIQKSV